MIAVVTGDLMAQHGLAWMPTLSGDTQAVLVTDKVRYQGQEVAAVIATDPYVATDALELIEVDYDILPPVTTPRQALEAGAPLIRDEKEGQTDNRVYDLGSRRQGCDRRRLRAGRSRREPRDALPALTSLAVGDVRHHRRRQLGDGSGNPLSHLAGAARAPHAVRDGRRATGTGHPHHQSRPRRRLRQQGADLPGLCRGDRREPLVATPGEVGRDRAARTSSPPASPATTT